MKNIITGLFLLLTSGIVSGRVPGTVPTTSPTTNLLNKVAVPTGESVIISNTGFRMGGRFDTQLQLDRGWAV